MKTRTGSLLAIGAAVVAMPFLLGSGDNGGCDPNHPAQLPDLGEDPDGCRNGAIAFNNTPVAWSCNGTIPGLHCIEIEEPSDGDGWNDHSNYFCMGFEQGGPAGAAPRWTYTGEDFPGMRCAQVYEGGEMNQDIWSDNWICIPSSSSFEFHWSEAGPIAGMTCIQWLEPQDANEAWEDNFLCWH